MRTRIHDQILYYCSLLLAFFIPVFPRALPIIIGLIILNWLISGVYLKTIPMLPKEKWRLKTLALSSLYILCMIGMLYSSNLDYGWFDLEVKMSLFIFPLVFATSSMTIFTTSRIQQLLFTFVTGCLTGSFILLIHALFVNEGTVVASSFYYSSFSWYFHPSYLAMYFNFGMVVAFFYLIRDFNGSSSSKKLLHLIIIFYLEAMLFLLSSKAGLLVMGTSQILVIIWLMQKRITFRYIAIISMVMFSTMAAYSVIFPNAFSRIARADEMTSAEHTVQTDPTDGTVARVEIWKVSLELIRKNLFFGVGTGDVKDILLESYRRNGLEPVFLQKLNAHNQYFQTFIALGFFGFTLLALMLLIPAIMSLKHREYLYFAFIAIIAINLLFESMLENQAGVVFYAFFNVLLFSVIQQAKDKTTSAAL